MQKIIFEDTVVVKKPYTSIDGIEHELQDGEYQGGTDLNANTFNTMQNNIETAINGVVESGNNTNGNWIKFNDGTLIQFGIINISANSNTKTVNLPTSFIDNTYTVFYQNVYTSRMYLFWAMGPKTTNTLQSYVSDTSGSTPTVASSSNYIAIGKWK